MTWKDIPGWFSEEDAKCYKIIADTCHLHGDIVEIGVWLGRSTACAVTHLIDQGKIFVTVHAVDTFKGSEEHAELIKEFHGSTYDAFMKNMHDLHISEFVKPIVEPSELAVQRFDDGVLDAVFIDGDHSKESVRADIHAWLPKIKKRGIIAGHDYNFSTVVLVVNAEFDGKKIEQYGDSWLVRL